MAKKFEDMKKRLKQKSDHMVAELRRLEEKESGDSKKKYEAAEKSEKEAIKSSGERKDEASKRAREKISKAEDDSKQAEQDLGEAERMKDSFAAKERKEERDKERKIRQLDREKGAAVNKIKEQIKETEEEAAAQEKKMMQKGNTTDAEYRKKQMAWLDRAKSSAMKNCDDAKKEAILKSKASHLSLSSLSRSIQDHSVVSSNAVEDSERKSQELEAAKKKSAENLQKIVAKTAKGMANGGEGAVDAVKKAAVAYAQNKLPADREKRTLKDAEAEARKAQKMAKKKNHEWATQKSLQAADEFKEKAEKICDSQQVWFGKVRHRVKKRLGTASEKDEKSAAKGEFQEQRWALRKVKLLLGKEKAVTEKSVKSEMKAGASAKDKQAFEEKSQKSKIEAAKERARKLKRGSAAQKAQAQFELKESIDAEDAKINEARKLRELAERDAKTQQKSAEKKEADQKISLKAKQKASLAKLNEREEKSLKLLKAKSAGREEKLREIRKKKRHLEEEARRREEKDVEEAKKVTAEKARRAHEEAQRKVREIKESLSEAKASADKRLLRAKLEAAKERAEAKRVMAEAMKTTGPESKKKIIMAAKAQAEKLLAGAKKRSVQLTKDARAEFEETVQKETQKSLKDVKTIKGELNSKITGLEAS